MGQFGYKRLYQVFHPLNFEKWEKRDKKCIWKCILMSVLQLEVYNLRCSPSCSQLAFLIGKTGSHFLFHQIWIPRERLLICVFITMKTKCYKILTATVFEMWPQELQQTYVQIFNAHQVYKILRIFTTTFNTAKINHWNYFMAHWEENSHSQGGSTRRTVAPGRL